jgi:hypothetical protein
LHRRSGVCVKLRDFPGEVFRQESNLADVLLKDQERMVVDCEDQIEKLIVGFRFFDAAFYDLPILAEFSDRFYRFDFPSQRGG